MPVVAWIVEGGWPAVIDAARTHAPAGAEIILLQVTEAAVPEVAHGAYAARPEGAATGSGNRREPSYDRYETTHVFVYAIGPARVLDAAKTAIEVHMGDGFPPDVLNLPGARNAFSTG